MARLTPGRVFMLLAAALAVAVLIAMVSVLLGGRRCTGRGAGGA